MILLRILGILGFVIALSFAAAFYCIGINAACKKLGIDTDGPWFPIVTLGSFILLVYDLGLFIDRHR